MKYEPISDKEFNERMLLPAGDYAFEVLFATESVSKSSGADMVTLDLLIHAGDGSNRKVKSYLVASDKGKFQVRAFCECTGIMPAYKNGTFSAESCLGRSGWLSLRVEEGNDKQDGSGKWPSKNSVKSFLANSPTKTSAPAALPAAPVTSAADNSITDDVPF
jgi:hypothetical protein